MHWLMRRSGKIKPYSHHRNKLHICGFEIDALRQRWQHRYITPVLFFLRILTDFLHRLFMPRKRDKLVGLLEPGRRWTCLSAIQYRVPAPWQSVLLVGSRIRGPRNRYCWLQDQCLAHPFPLASGSWLLIQSYRWEGLILCPSGNLWVSSMNHL